MNSPFHFTLTSRLLNKHEQAIFKADIKHLGLDPLIWTILNGSVETRTKHSEIKILRGYKNRALCGVLYVVLCKRYGNCLVANPLMASLINFPAIPIFIWMRTISATDMINNPGFVRSGNSRAEFVSSALSYLQNKYLSGFVVEISSGKDKTGGIALPFADYGIIDLSNINTIDAYLGRYRNIRKKMNKFFNKGGSVRTVYGALTTETQSQIREIYKNIKPTLSTPFQDNYTNLVMQISQTGSDKIVHFLSYLGNQHLVGYHSFACMERSLYCLSGAFDRSMHSTFHAYENMIIETVKFGLANHIRKIFYGPVLNPTKARMMNQFRLCEQRLYTRFSILNKAFPWLSNYLSINPGNFKSFVHITANQEQS